MMRKIVIMVLILLIPTIFVLTKAEATPYVTLEPAVTDVYVGESFSIDVIANGIMDVDPFSGLADELLAFGFDVEYPSAGITYEGAEVSPPFIDDSGLFSETDVAGSVFPGVSGNNILLATLMFTANEVGLYTVGVITDELDVNEGLITFLHPKVDFSEYVEVNVSSGQPSAPIPEPGTIMMVGSGLFGVFYFRKTKRSK